MIKEGYAEIRTTRLMGLDVGPDGFTFAFCIFLKKQTKPMWNLVFSSLSKFANYDC